jgi:large subunit ribosomal protein L15
MKLHDLQPNPGAKKNRKRVGRGIAAGQGKTAGRGMKGQNSRAGGGTRLYFTGGNLPFFRRLPYMRGLGMTVINRVTYNEVNLDQLDGFAKGSQVNPETLAEAGLLRDPRNPVVLLGRGKLDRTLKVQVHRISAGARRKVEEAGGSVEIVEG